MADVQVSYYSLSNLENKVANIENMTAQVSNQVSYLQGSVDKTNQDLAELRQQFMMMMQQQKLDAALQRASTELIRVRQEIEDKFGNYKVVRDTMLGVLQATDSALVKQTTISRVSEELMLSTPKYWLAPCLVAVAAWIGNDRDLAERAIKEAVKRDEEKTAITMALICRRNKKTDACYEWLSIYFENQDPSSFTEGDFAYIDAYVNGVFGPDEKHMCDGYIEKWMDEIRSSDAAYEENQARMWKEYCVQFAGDCGELYPDLRDLSPDFPTINDYISRINAVEPIMSNFTKITDAHVDQESLKKEIDRNLIELISKYDDDEMSLRNDEKYFLAVKKHAGDEVAARQMFEESMSENRMKVRSLIEQMYEVVNKSEGVSTSQKKTAISFLKTEINNGFNQFVKENKSSFPEKVSMSVYGYETEVTDGLNKDSAVRDFVTFNERNMRRDLATAQNDKKPLIFMISGIVVAVIALILLFTVPFLGVVALVGAGFLGFKAFKAKKDMAANLVNIKTQYSNQSRDGVVKLKNAIDQWVDVKQRVEEFDDSNIRAVS